MDVIVLIGRILFSILFLFSALGHLTATKQLAGYAGSKGVPFPVTATFVAGLLLLAGGVMVVLGIWADLGTLLLVAFLVPTALVMHGFWREPAESRAMEQVQFNKDMALAGASLMLFAFFAFVGDDLGLTITGPLFSLSLISSPASAENMLDRPPRLQLAWTRGGGVRFASGTPASGPLAQLAELRTFNP